jgi:carbon-monoxide dehydrogenase medium subunit
MEFNYSNPKNISDLFALLEQYGNSAAMLAGGTDLVNHIREGKRSPQQVLELKNVKELNREIEYRENGLIIGALATLADIETHGLIRELFPAIAESANKVGSKQIRNRATLVGNICNASPAADTAPALLIYNAEVNIISRHGRRSIPVESFIKGPGKTDLKPGEVVESICVPNPPSPSSSCYVKLARREGADLTIVGVAALLSEKGEVRVGLGAVAPVPFRAYSAEALLSKGLEDPIAFEKGLEAAVSQANPISDLRGTREYRLAMIKVITRKALEICRNKMSDKRLV